MSRQGKESIRFWLSVLIRPKQELIILRQESSWGWPLFFMTSVQAILYYLIAIIEPAVLDVFGSVADLSGLLFALYGAVSVPLTLVMSSFVQWLIALLMRERLNYRKLFQLNIYLWLVILLKDLVILISVTGFEADFSAPVSSLAYYLELEEPVDRLAGMVELFSIWHFSLVALGLQAVFSLPPKKAWIIALEAFFAEAGLILLLA